MDKVKLDRNKHSVYLFYYHLILVLKYRKKVIDYRISNGLKETFEYICLYRTSRGGKVRIDAFKLC